MAIKNLGNMDTRQKIIAVIFVIFLGALGWFGYTTFFAGPSAEEIAMNQAAPPPMPTPKAAAVPTLTETTSASPAPATGATATSTADANQVVLDPNQQEVIQSVNELQKLKLTQALIETNEKIVKSRESTVQSQMKIISMLTPPAPPPSTTAVVDITTGQPKVDAVNYTIVSITQLQGKWSAVMSYNTNLYSVRSGDTLPPDGSKVVSIDKTGVVVDKDGLRRRFSLLSVI